ncbi:hypothetical protein C0995_011649, partial [Termitomyces sp. Mi166
DLQSPIQGEEDMDFVLPRHIPTCFMCVKEDGTTGPLHYKRSQARGCEAVGASNGMTQDVLGGGSLL